MANIRFCGAVQCVNNNDGDCVLDNIYLDHILDTDGWSVRCMGYEEDMQKVTEIKMTI